jgi:glycosyltransferase involved in cell wall biosynthesis
MLKQEKIIFIDGPAKWNKEVVFEDNPESDYFFHQGWSTQIAKLIKKKSDHYRVEIWRIDSRVNEIKERTVEGIICKIFPRKDYLSSFPYSRLFFIELRKELKKSAVLIHIPALHKVFNLLVSMTLKKVPLVAHQTGGPNALWRFRKNKKIRSLIFSFFERKIFFKKLDIAYCVGEEERKYLGSEMDNEKIMDFSLQTIDFNLFYRRDKDKAREKLGLPLKKKIILQPYRATTSDGSGISIDAWEKHLKEKGILLYMINIHESNELYQKVIDSGIEFRGRYRLDEMPFWYSAVDLVIYPAFDEELLSFGGVGYSPLESLACGTPVVGTTLRSFPNYREEESNLKRICRIPDKPEDVGPMILDLLENPSDPDECRNLVFKYLNEDYISTVYLNHVNNLFDKYYRNVL